ncbi:MAG: hypothetical protein SFW67_31735 [Myxococcaceae bacterium]|nr:hypothetical protein [Myxococcaceae bacterium]
MARGVFLVMWFMPLVAHAAPPPKVIGPRAETLVPLATPDSLLVALMRGAPAMAYTEKGVVKLLRAGQSTPLSLGGVNKHSKLSFTSDGAYLVGERDASVVGMPTHGERPAVAISRTLSVKPGEFVVGARAVALRTSSDWLFLTDVEGSRLVQIPLLPPLIPEGGCPPWNSPVEFSRGDTWLLVRSGCSFKLVKVDTLEVRDVDATSARFVGDRLVSHNDRAHPMNFVVNLVARRPRRVEIPATALDVLELSTNTRWSLEGVTLAGADFFEDERLVTLTTTQATIVDLRARTHRVVKLEGFTGTFVKGRLFVLRLGAVAGSDRPVELCEVELNGKHRVVASFGATSASFATPPRDPQLVLVGVRTKEGGYVLELGEGDLLVKWVTPSGDVSPAANGTTWVGHAQSGVFGPPRIWR